MIAIQTSPASFKFSPENEAERKCMESWSLRKVAVESVQRTMDDELTGIVLAFGSER